MSSIHRRLVYALLLLFGATVFLPTVQAAEKTVTIGLQQNDNLWKYPISQGAFEKATGYTIHWRLFTSGSQVISAMASGDVQIAMAGSTPIAAAVSHGVPVQLFWILEGIGESEELVVRNGSGISKPSDLKGKKLATPQASTSDLDLHLALQGWNIPESTVQLFNLQPTAITAAWRRGDIDGAFIWEPALSEIKKTGKVLTTSGKICDKQGVCTFNGLVVLKEWSSEHPDFMVSFVQTIAKNVDDYLHNKSMWTADSPMVKAIAKYTGVDPEVVPAVLASYDYPSLNEELSDKWLGGGANKYIRESAMFLKEQKQIPKVLPDYSAYVTAKWARMAQDKTQ